jgi:hypothetical protein
MSYQAPPRDIPYETPPRDMSYQAPPRDIPYEISSDNDFVMIESFAEPPTGPTPLFPSIDNKLYSADGTLSVPMEISSSSQSPSSVHELMTVDLYDDDGTVSKSMGMSSFSRNSSPELVIDLCSEDSEAASNNISSRHEECVSENYSLSDNVESFHIVNTADGDVCPHSSDQRICTSGYSMISPLVVSSTVDFKPSLPLGPVDPKASENHEECSNQPIEDDCFQDSPNNGLEPGEIVSDIEEGELAPSPLIKTPSSASFVNLEPHVKPIPFGSKPPFSRSKPVSLKPSNPSPSKSPHTRKRKRRPPKRIVAVLADHVNRNQSRSNSLQKKRKSRLFSSIDDDVELLELRKKALLTMIPNDVTEQNDISISNSLEANSDKSSCSHVDTPSLSSVSSTIPCTSNMVVANDLVGTSTATPTVAVSPLPTPLDSFSSSSVLLASHGINASASFNRSESSVSDNDSTVVQSDNSERSSVKIVPSSSDTWIIKDFSIVTAAGDDESDMEDLNPVDKMINACRKAAESEITLRSDLSKQLSMLTTSLTHEEVRSQSLEEKVDKLNKELKIAQAELDQCQKDKIALQEKIYNIKVTLDQKTMVPNGVSTVQVVNKKNELRSVTTDTKHKKESLAKDDDKKKQLLQAVQERKTQLAKVKQSYISLLKKKNKFNSKKKSLKSFVSSNYTNSKLKSQTMNSLQVKTHSKVAKTPPTASTHRTATISTTKLEPAVADQPVEILDKIFKQLKWERDQHTLDKLKSWSPALTVSDSLVYITDINIATGKCFNLLPLPSLIYSASKSPNTSSSASNSLINPSHNNNGTCCYVSPLLAFKAYRVNPLYRAVFKLPLSSQTHSHSINPHVPFCRYESQGKCNDASCIAQHWNNVSLSDDGIVNDLLQYINHQESSKLDNDIRSKMSNKEWLLLTVDNIRQQLNSGSPIISASENWMKKNNSIVAVSNMVSKEFLVPPVFKCKLKLPLIDGKKKFRYFDQLDDHDKLMLQLREHINQGDDEVALDLLTEAIKDDSANEFLWICYIRLSNDENINEQAFSALPVYNIFKEIILCSKTLNKKRDWIVKTYCALIKEENVSSHNLLELVCSYLKLEVIQGQLTSALNILKMIFSDNQSDLFPNLISNLVQNDRVFLGLIYLYLIRFKHLPCQVFGDSIPVTIEKKDPFFILWDETDDLQTIDINMAIFRVILKACTIKDISITDNVSSCIPLYFNLFMYEISQARHESALLSLDKLIAVAPQILQLKLFRFSLTANLNDGNITEAIPHPLYYYTVARLHLNKVSPGIQYLATMSDIVGCSLTRNKLLNR